MELDWEIGFLAQDSPCHTILIPQGLRLYGCMTFEIVLWGFFYTADRCSSTFSFRICICSYHGTEGITKCEFRVVRSSFLVIVEFLSKALGERKV